MTDDKIRARLMKLLELAKRGEHGEKENAQRFLEKLLKKHGMTVADLDDDATAKSRYKFTYKSELESRLLTQIICTVLQVNRYTKRQVRGSRTIELDLTRAQNLEIAMQFSVYRAELARNVDRMFTAFYTKNGLTGPDSDDDAPRAKRTYSAEEVEAIRRMMRGIDRTQIHKALEG
jgi:hypothetical protein